MRYIKTYSSQATDPKRLAEMLAMQEANQKIGTDYAAIPKMDSASQTVDPMELMRMRQMMMAQQSRNLGRNTYDTVTPMNTRGLA